ncbi:Protein F54E2.2 [Aphelenchoides avenae]|nr:Protein F54E2.2 [Aphelenchus avenae]
MALSYEQYVEKVSEQQQPKVREPPATVKPSFKRCFFKYSPHTCNVNEYCDSNKLCVDVTGNPCCAPPRGVCPTQDQLDVKCRKGKPTSWCIQHKDCLKGALCCPTGCDYNICVNQN